jgi:hypothetical protein
MVSSPSNVSLLPCQTYLAFLCVGAYGTLAYVSTATRCALPAR